MSVEQILLILGTAALNVATTLAVVNVKLQFLRRDVDHAHRRLDHLGAPHAWEPERSGSD